MGYQDVVAIEDLLRPPTVDDSGIAELIADQGIAVQGVDWLFQQVTGESLTEKVIMPITGDWPRIAANADAWRNTASAVQAISDNLTANVDTLQDHWDGSASDSFGDHIRVVWFAGLYAQAGVASLIGEGFDVVSSESRRLCGEALELLNRLVEKLVSAAATAWIPVYGWGRAVKAVWDAYQLYQAIRELIDTVRGVIEAAKALFDALGDIRSALAAIPDVRNANDAAQVIGQLVDGADDALDAVQDVHDAVSGADAEYATATGRVAGGGSTSW
jgi:hypothetical protein